METMHRRLLIDRIADIRLTGHLSFTIEDIQAGDLKSHGVAVALPLWMSSSCLCSKSV